jgi:hypothetical protein
MAYILSAQRDSGQSDDLWDQYQRYIHANRDRFPPGAFALATSDWYYGFDDHRAPHDAWLASAKFEELATGERSEIRHLSLRIRLLGAYHDHHLEFFYPEVYAYSMINVASRSGQGDWRYDEFRLSSEGRLLHEIEWAGSQGAEGTRWIVEASDVEFSVVAIERMGTES